MIANGVFDVRIDDLPEAPGLPVCLPGRVQLMGKRGGHTVEDVAPGIALALRARLEIGFGHRVVLAVHHHVQTRTEKMLVGRAIELGRDHAAPTGWASTGSQRGGLDDTGQLGFELNRTVLIEVPEKTIVVVGHGAEEADHQAPGATHFEYAGTKLIVLPQRAVIFLVHADGVLHDKRFALIIDRGHIEISNRAQAIAAELQLVGQTSKAVFTAVERAFPVMIELVIRIGNAHVGDTGAIEDRAHDVAVLVAQLVQNQTLTRREADAELPVLPVHFPVIDGEAHALGLRDVQRLEPVARLAQGR
ncbi:hypothetical protein D3C75_754890 [compost metagenome]